MKLPGGLSPLSLELALPSPVVLVLVSVRWAEITRLMKVRGEMRKVGWKV